MNPIRVLYTYDRNPYTLVEVPPRVAAIASLVQAGEHEDLVELSPVPFTRSVTAFVRPWWNLIRGHAINRTAEDLLGRPDGGRLRGAVVFAGSGLGPGDPLEIELLGVPENFILHVARTQAGGVKHRN